MITIGSCTKGIAMFLGRRRESEATVSSANAKILLLKIKGMHCGGCASSIERFIKRQKGVVKARIDYSKGTGTILYNPDGISKENIVGLPIFKEPYQFQAEMIDEQEPDKGVV